MGKIKDELQNIIFGNGPNGPETSLKKIQIHLRGDEKTGINAKKQQYLRSEETASLLNFIEKERLWYTKPIRAENFISEGAEQKVYQLSGSEVIKTNAAIFYEYWLDYFNSLLIHNYFFPETAYSLLGFIKVENELNAVVKQNFIKVLDATDLIKVKLFLEHNNFQIKRNHDYFNDELGIILEDLHGENVLSSNDVLFFIDTIFYLTEDFYT